ncbi:MAG: hypothetical protein JSR64_17120 [Nitrospira sp.]|nr:hypothetical protein [Nitrospira sp.]
MDSPTIGDLYYDEFEVSPEWEGFSAAAIYSALRAWIESDQTDLEWVEFDDQDKFRY